MKLDCQSNLKVFGSLIFLMLLGCSSVQRTPESGYTNDGTLIHSRAQAGTSQAPRSSHSLKVLENAIPTQKEIEQYSRVLPYLFTENEKIQFLSLPTFEAKENWLKQIDIAFRVRQVDQTYRDIIANQDVAIGMTQAQLRRSWGEPDRVETSGRPEFMNQKWIYSQQISTPAGFAPQRRVVYFEGGRVTGWETL